MTMGIRKIPLGLCCYLFSAVSASAGPVNGQVAAGSITIQGQNTPNTTVIQQTPRAIVNWNSFNLGAGESVRFVQPDGSSVILNRVVGNLGPSQIYGTLTANGRVFIVNPDGILIGAGARIDTAGFLASVHDIRNEDFMLGNYRFTIPGRPDASIVNLGTINAHSQGFAALVAPAVRNDGVIVARLGKIALASANEFVLDFYGDRLIQLSVNDAIASKVRDVATGQVLTSLVQNNGKLKANGGQVQLTAVTARQVVDAVVNNRGVIEANTVKQHGGVIILGAPVAKTKQQDAPTQNVVVSGAISAQGKKKNGTGGYIEITGENIQLTNANLNASGNIKGGTVLIGGDLSGGQIDATLAAILRSTPETKAIPTATSVRIDTLSILNASALKNGNGGKIIVWADGTTNFAGLAVNRGGDNSGDGGLLEISGKKNLTFAGSVDLRAPNGVTGSLLLDPENVVIGNGPGSTTFVSTLQATLANANVVVTTNGAVAGDGDITIAASITWATNNSLTLNAHRNIVINDGVTISNTAAGNLTLNADSQRTGVGYVNFIGSAKIDYSASTGTVEILYNPPLGYSFPVNYASSVLQNIAAVDQFTAYMLVNNINDLQNISQNLSGVYGLGSNIDASVTVSWNNGEGFRPIGGPLFDSFTGTLNGFGHVIDRLTINATPSPNSHVGLFHTVGFLTPAHILNIGLTNVSIGGGNDAAGALVGYLFSGSIRNSFATGSVISPDGIIVGGLVGLNQGLITDSYFNGTVRGYQLTGGLVGSSQDAQSATVTRSFSTGSVTGVSPTSIVGGLVGYNNAGIISFSYSTASVQGQFETGGLAGASFHGRISQSYALGNVTGASNNTLPFQEFLPGTGGLIGFAFSSNDSAYPPSFIIQSYAAGTINASPYSGGLVGVQGILPTSISNSYWDQQSSGTLISAGGVGLTTSQLKSGLPAGFSPSVWAISSSVNNGYPYLRWAFTASSAAALPQNTSPYGTAQVQALDQIRKVALGQGGDFSVLDVKTHEPVVISDAVKNQIAAIIAKIPPLDANLWTGVSGPISANDLIRNTRVFILAAEAVYHLNEPALANVLGESPIDWKNIVLFPNDLDADKKFKKDATSAGFEAAIYKVDGKLILSFKGSDDPRSLDAILSDWIPTNGFNSLIGLVNRIPFVPDRSSAEVFQYAVGLALVEAVQRAYPNEKLYLTGHSLGGAISAFSGAMLGVPTITFNAAGISLTNAPANANANVINFQTEKDRAGLFGTIVGTTVVFNLRTINVENAPTSVLTRHLLDGFTVVTDLAAQGKLKFTGFQRGDRLGSILREGNIYFVGVQ
ncbi:MAG: filamentous hemagglutinin N-terminal domain-containing protein [Xanthobacteraceae bacterium]|nr:filamentous hemagglutinin N-terminal domain-containing protein [Xanthobacteraceae bacterium]